jgi:rubrerythrin
MSAAWLRLLQKVCKYCGYKHWNYKVCPICERYAK